MPGKPDLIMVKSGKGGALARPWPWPASTSTTASTSMAADITEPRIMPVPARIPLPGRSIRAGFSKARD